MTTLHDLRVSKVFAIGLEAHFIVKKSHLEDKNRLKKNCIVNVLQCNGSYYVVN